MTARLIDGKSQAAILRRAVADAVLVLKDRLGRAPGLAVVLVGEDPASQVYVRNKRSAAAEVGILGEEIRLPAQTDREKLNRTIDRLNDDPNVDGILVQFPLPGHLSQEEVLDRLNPAKDVDGLTVHNMGLLSAGRPGLVPCTPQGVMMLLKSQDVPLAGAHAVVLGRSLLVGTPIAQLLLAEHCTVTIAHSRSKVLSALCQSADILVAAVGRPHLVQGTWVKPGAIVLDVGINRVDLGNGTTKLLGDVDTAAASQVARAITPVPGGVGPMTIACLLRNTVLAAAARAGLDSPVGL